MKALDGDKALLFPSVAGHTVPVIGNLLCSRENCEAAFGVDFREIRNFVDRAMGEPIPPRLVSKAPAQEIVLREGFDIRKIVPALFHAPGDGGHFITAGIVIVRDPETGVYNASYHRLQVHGPDRVGVKLDYGRHLRAAYERAKRRGEPLTVAVCIGADLALHFTAATMGSQMPEHADELAVAGGLCGRPLSVIRAVSQDLLVPAEAEFILEGQMLADEEEVEGPFGEFIGFAAPGAPAPVLKISAVTHRAKPIYHAINGYGRETVVLRKYVLEASLLKVLRAAVPIVKDAEMTAGGLHRFHAIIQVEKKSSQHDGLQRNAILAAFGALKDLDLVIVVDEDIDIRDPHGCRVCACHPHGGVARPHPGPGSARPRICEGRQQRNSNQARHRRFGPVRRRRSASAAWSSQRLDQPGRLFVSDRAAAEACLEAGEPRPE